MQTVIDGLVLALADESGRFERQSLLHKFLLVLIRGESGPLFDSALVSLHGLALARRHLAVGAHGGEAGATVESHLWGE